jgi:hypothetical protein
MKELFIRTLFIFIIIGILSGLHAYFEDRGMITEASVIIYAMMVVLAFQLIEFARNWNGH